MSRLQNPATVLFLVASLLAGLTGTAWAADHRDAPITLIDTTNDITDFYVFRSPRDSNNLVMIANFDPLAVPTDPFPRRGLAIYVDQDADLNEDTVYTFKFSKVKNGRQRVKLRVTGTAGTVAKGKTTRFGDAPRIIEGKNGEQLFAGQRDDPFYADAGPLTNTFNCLTDPARDSFAGTNVNSVVLEVPIDNLWNGDDPLFLWIETKKDRAGAPLVETLFIPPNRFNPNGNPTLKNKFNRGHPRDDLEDYGPGVLATLSIFNGPEEAQRLLPWILPNGLVYDPQQRDRYPNGRRLKDDVVDSLLDKVTGGIEPTDCVRRNDVPFLDEFPYLAAPHQTNER